MSSYPPVVLSFSGHDPSGGAGIQADIETLVSHQCHACSIVTALTEQDSSQVKKIIPQKAQDIIDQANTVLNDFQVKVIKIGLIAYHETATAIQSILLQHPDIPVVFDPVLVAGGGASLADKALILNIIEQILPHTTILTPNSVEARLLSQQDNLSACAETLLAKGCEYVLITGTHEQSATVQNRLFQLDKEVVSFSWERLKENYHGSGCTLASAIAALMAHGLGPFTAISEAQEYTWNSLAAAYQPAKGQFNPNRLFWLEQSE